MQAATRFWTFNSLVGAFLDLYIAFLLLCGSSIAYFAVKFLNLFGLSLPPSYGGNPNSDYKTLLVDYPTDKVSAVQFSVTRKFPFDSVFYRVQNHNPIPNDALNLEINNEGEASCSSKSNARKSKFETDDSGVRIQKEREFDFKGKEGLNYRIKGGFRRRRKGSFDSGKHSSVSSSTNWVTCVDQPNNNDNENSGGLDGSSVNYDGEPLMMLKSDVLKRIPVNEADKDEMIVLLTQDLEESQAARAALYVELDKERSAAATAADEAMSMILRLQEEKASIEMESRQYQRMIEEKSAYDEEEMNILKEIVLRREREKHFLEKEVEAYRQMIHGENDQISSIGDIQDFDKDLDLKTNLRFYEAVDFLKQEEPEKTIDIVKEEKGFETKADDSFNETDSRVYDVHVIDHKPKSSEKLNRNKKQNRSGSEMSVGLPPVSSNSSSKSSLRRNSTSALDNERSKLDTEVEWLRERLRIVQEGRDKLNFSIDNREKESLQLQLLEDIARQLQEIRMLTEPRTARQASLPLPSSKGVTKKRRCRSASSGPPKSS